MGYSQTDLDNVRQAINDLANGHRVTEVSFEGVATKYQQADLSELQTLEARITRVLANSTTPRFSVFMTSKGL